MRGVKDHPAAPAASPAASGAGESDQLTAALRETAAELRAVREELARHRPA